MQQSIRVTLISTAMAVLAAACSQQAADAAAGTRTAPKAPPATAAAAGGGGQAFADPAAGIVLHTVPHTTVRRDFKRGYLALDHWKLYPAAGSTGTPLVAMVLDGSNVVTAAEMRIGRSTGEADIKACTTPPQEATGPVGSVEVGGVPFVHFSVSDAAMSHYLSAESYRAVHRGTCYAIDLIVAGTRPEVYDPPRIPPFTQDQATRKLAAMLAAVQWAR